MVSCGLLVRRRNSHSQRGRPEARPLRAAAPARVRALCFAAPYNDIKSLLEDILWNYKLVNPEAMRAALDE